MLRLLSSAFLLGCLGTAAGAQVEGKRVSAELVSNGSFIKHFGELEGAALNIGGDEITLSSNELSSALKLTEDGLIVLELAPENFRSASLIDLGSQTVRFTPTDVGYTAEAIDLQFEESIGSWFNSYDGDAWSSDQFTFPFAGSVWDQMYINHVGSITFQKKPSPGDGFASLESELTKLITRTQPTLSPLYFHQWSTTTHVNELSDRLVITWDAIWGSGDGIFDIDADADRSVFQAVLYADGTIDFNYKSLGTEVGVVGIFPFVPAGIPDFSSILPEDLEGTYRLDNYSNEWHEGDISVQSGALQWTNRADAQWELDAARLASDGVLETINSPYEGYDEEFESFKFEMLAGVIIGFEYLDAFYVRQTEEVAQLLAPPEKLDFSAAISSSFSGGGYEAFLYSASPDLGAVTCSVLPEVGDNYDFFVMYSQFRLDKAMAGSGMTVISNAIEGIGIGKFSRSAN